MKYNLERMANTTPQMAWHRRTLLTNVLQFGQHFQSLEAPEQIWGYQAGDLKSYVNMAYPI